MKVYYTVIAGGGGEGGFFDLLICLAFCFSNFSGIKQALTYVLYILLVNRSFAWTIVSLSLCVMIKYWIFTFMIPNRSFQNLLSMVLSRSVPDSRSGVSLSLCLLVLLVNLQNENISFEYLGNLPFYFLQLICAF